jgi:hypothetical protein
MPDGILSNDSYLASQLSRHKESRLRNCVAAGTLTPVSRRRRDCRERCERLDGSMAWCSYLCLRRAGIAGFEGGC